MKKGRENAKSVAELCTLRLGSKVRRPEWLPKYNVTVTQEEHTSFLFPSPHLTHIILIFHINQSKHKSN